MELRPKSAQGQGWSECLVVAPNKHSGYHYLCLVGEPELMVSSFKVFIFNEYFCTDYGTM